jgi:signal peptidase I
VKKLTAKWGIMTMNKTWNIFKNWVMPILVGLLVAFLVKTYVFSMVRVDGHSMDPNLANNERVFVSKIEKIKRNAIIVFNAHNVDPRATGSVFYVKRVIGLPGDKISYSQNGVLSINGKKTSQNYIDKEQSLSGTLSPIGMEKTGFNLKTLAAKEGWKNNRLVIPKGKYFVLGDNRYVSNDSRYWGLVPASKIEGTVKIPFWQHN